MIPDVKKIQVLYQDLHVGTLQMDSSLGVCVFEYEKSWLAGGLSLSPTELPLQSGLFYANKDKLDGVFAVFEDSLPDGYGLYLLDRILKKNHTSLRELTPLQRLSIIGNGGMGALTYRPVMTDLQTQKELEGEDRLDLLQEEALSVLSEKGSGDASLLYYRSSNSGGARPKVVMRTANGVHWLVKFRHTYDAVDIGKTELLYMKTARECGITIPRIGLI